MGARVVAAVALAAMVGVGCSAADLKARKDGAWSSIPQGLPDRYEPQPGGYGHPFRLVALILNPLGVAADYAVVRPFYLLGGLAPEWFGATVDDGQRYQEHFPELAVPRDAPRRFDPSD